ncbi:MAG: hypothetical protein AAFQ87_25780, partial [Bacteroidota bacterium]
MIASLRVEAEKRFVPLDEKADAHGPVEILLIDSTLWGGNVFRGLERYEGTGFAQRKSYAADMPHPYVESLSLDSAGRFWVGTYDGVVWRESESTEFQAFDFHQSPGRTYDILTSREGHVWLGTDRGLWQIREQPPRFETFSLQQSPPFQLPSADILGMYETRSGELWAIAYDYGLLRLIPTENWQTYYYPAAEIGLPTAQNISLIEGQEGELWLSSFSGLVRLKIPDYDDPTKASPPEVTNWQPHPDGLGSPYITHTLFAPDGSLWVSSFTAGLELVRIQGDSLKREERWLDNGKDPFTLLDRRPGTLQFDQEGNLWVCSRRGLSRMYTNEKGERAFRHILLPPIDSANMVGQEIKMYYQDETGVMWLAGKGLIRLELLPGAEQTPWELDVSPFLPVKWTHIGLDDGLSNESIYAILADSSGSLWLTHNLGLDRYDPADGSVRSYRQEDGLQSNEFSANAYAYGQNGHLWVGGIAGFSRFQPARLQDASLVPRATLSEISLYNQALQVGQSIE